MAKASLILGILTWISIFLGNLFPRVSIGVVLWLLIAAGLVTAIIALVKKSHRGTAVIGLILNLVPVFLFIAAVVAFRKPGS